MDVDYMDIDGSYFYMDPMSIEYTRPLGVSIQRTQQSPRQIFKRLMPSYNTLKKYYSLYYTGKKNLSLLKGEAKQNKKEEIENYITLIDQKINTIEAAGLERALKSIENPPNVWLRFSRLGPESKERFYDPSYFLFLKRFINNIVHHEDDIDHTIRIRHWFDHLQVISAGSFGKTIKAGISTINDLFVMKVPIHPAADQRHEFLAGIAINDLRERSLTPNFVYTYNFFTCSPPKYQGDRVIGYCAPSSDEKSQYLLLENIENVGLLSDFIKVGMTLPQFVSIFLQIAFSIHIAKKEKKFTHWDLHISNILIRKDPKKRFVTYNIDGKQYTFNTEGVIPVIFDFGLSSYGTQDEDGSDVVVGPRMDVIERTSNYFSGDPFPLADIYRIIMSIYIHMVKYVLIKSPTNEEKKIANMLEDMIRPFFEVTRYVNQKAILNTLFQLRDEVLNDNNDNNDDYNPREDILSFNFEILEPYYSTLDVTDYLQRVLSDNGAIGKLYKIKWYDLNKLNPNNIVSCLPEGKCLTGAILEQRFGRHPETYHEADQINTNLAILPLNEKRFIAHNTRLILTGHRKTLSIAHIILQKNFNYEYHNIIPSSNPREIKEFNDYVNEALLLWHTVSEIVYIHYLVNRFEHQMHDIKEHQDMTHDLDKVRYDKLSRVLSDTLNRIKEVERRFSGVNDQQFLDSLQAARILLSFDVAMVNVSYSGHNTENEPSLEEEEWLNANSDNESSKESAQSLDDSEESFESSPHSLEESSYSFEESETTS